MTITIRSTAAEMAQALAEGTVTSVELTQLHLDRVAAVDGAVHAFLHVDAEGALAHGIDCLGVAWGFADEDELGTGFAAVARDAAELGELLARYTAPAPTGR